MEKPAQLLVDFKEIWVNFCLGPKRQGRMMLPVLFGLLALGSSLMAGWKIYLIFQTSLAFWLPFLLGLVIFALVGPSAVFIIDHPDDPKAKGVTTMIASTDKNGDTFIRLE